METAKMKTTKIVDFNKNIPLLPEAANECTEPLGVLHRKGNCSQVEVDLNSLKRLENEILTTRLSCVATSM
jgi:hypothetical protein